jgi:hypothetical protein
MKLGMVAQVYNPGGWRFAASQGKEFQRPYLKKKKKKKPNTHTHTHKAKGW